MKEYHKNDKSTFILGWYIDTELCDEIVSAGEENKEIFSSGVMEYRDIDLKYFNTNLYQSYCKELMKVVDLYKEQFTLCYRDLNRWAVTNPRLQRYDPGKYYHQNHCENDGFTINQPRHLAYMTYLNDINNGGGTFFQHQNFTSDAKKGLTLIWPAGWTHYHQGVLAPTETKYITTGWCMFLSDH